jgi:Methyltransferase domain/C-methyltransferase C-terminal domain
VKACPLCGQSKLRALYRVQGLPIFQNKVYDSVAAARSAEVGDVVLTQCESCGFVFNAAFEQARMAYDATYQNEQIFSEAFQAHLDQVADIIISKAGADKSILEIGCGKGGFFDRLKKRGVCRIKGFDPIYEGEDPDIVKAYFGSGSLSEPADFIVLRHTLEHIEAPLAFLHLIAQANGYRGRIYIEVPSFEWIVEQSAYWDVFYEHCNYFTRDTLCSLFRKSEWYPLFAGQHQAVIADLADLVEKPSAAAPNMYAAFADVGARYASLLPGQATVFVWGASSKGVTLCNHVDRSCTRIRGLIDINPAKQGRFTAVTGHPIFAPGHLDNLADEQLTVLVTNPNYLREIRAQTAHLRAAFVTL